MPIIKQQIDAHAMDSFMQYAEYAIHERGIPDVRDGLKNVQRRLIYASYQLPGYRPDGKFIKSAKVVGDTMGNFHPHGDKAIYDTMVNMTQEFNMNTPMFIKKGNWGDVLGNPAAAMRYTEAKPSEAMMLMLKGIEKGVVPMLPNFDGSKNEPEYLPAMLPNLLINGSLGIAVGVNCLFPPHNVGEVIEACNLLIDKPKSSIEDIMEILKGPDYPTGGRVLNKDDIIRIYKEGRGVINVSGDYEIQGNKIIITSLPYKFDQKKFKDNLADLSENDALPGVKDFSFESDSRGLRIVVTADSVAEVDSVLQLFMKKVGLSTSYTVTFKALGESGLLDLNIKQIIEEFIKHRTAMIRKEKEFDLGKSEHKLSQLNAVKYLAEHREEVLAILSVSVDKADASQRILDSSGLTPEQVEYIVSLPFYKITKSEVKKTEVEIAGVSKEISEIRDILASDKKIHLIIKKQLTEFAKHNAVPRRTKLVNETYLLKKPQKGVEEEITAVDNKPVRVSFDNNDIKIENNEKKGVVLEGNQTITILSKRGIAYNIKAADLETRSSPVEAGEVQHIALEPYKTLVVTSDGLVGYYDIDQSQRKALKIPLQDSAKILVHEHKDDFSALLLISNKGRISVIPKENIEGPSRIVGPLPAVLLAPGEHIKEARFVDSTENKLILAVSESGDYYQTYFSDLPAWQPHQPMLSALPHAKFKNLHIGVVDENATADLKLSDGNIMQLDTSKFMKLNRSKEVSKYKARIKGKASVTGVK